MDQGTVGDRRIVLEDVLDTGKAASLRELFLARRGGDVAVDASGVRHLGALCAQVLLSATATWRSEERNLVIVNASEPFREGIATLGLHPFINCEV
jgi:chemotaxis protein CheX